MMKDMDESVSHACLVELMMGRIMSGEIGKLPT